MTREEAAMKLSLHLMQCGMLMPIKWVQQNGEGSETSEAFRMAISALREQESLEKKTSDSKTSDKKTSDWISVEERLPSAEFLDKEIIVCKLNRFGGQLVYVTRFWGTHSALWNDITHWMPLPEPPEEEV